MNNMNNRNNRLNNNMNNNYCLSNADIIFLPAKVWGNINMNNPQQQQQQSQQPQQEQDELEGNIHRSEE